MTQEEIALQSEESIPAQQEEPQVPAQPEEPQKPLTMDDVDAAFENPEKAEEMRKMLFEKQEQTAQENVTVEDDTQQPAPEQPSGDAEKPSIFSINYRGESIELADDNGLLGYETVGHLKKSKAHADLRIKDLDSRVSDARKHAEEQTRIAKEFKSKYDEMIKKQSESPAAPKPTTPPTKPPVVPAQPAVKVSKPTWPGIPEDPTEWSVEDAKAFRGYQDKIVEYVESASASAVVPDDRISAIAQERAAELTKALSDKLEEANSKIAEYGSVIDDVKKTKQQLQQEREHDAYWNSFSSFQNDNKEEFGTSTPVQELHNKTMRWMDDLAASMGYIKPYDQNDPKYNEYLLSRNNIASAYLSGNKEVIDRTQGIEPPAEHDKYFKLAGKMEELRAEKQRYVDNGILGKNASFTTVYEQMLKDSGQLDTDINLLRKTERERGQKAITDAIKNRQEYATPVPNAMAQHESETSEFTREDLMWALNMDGATLNRLSKEEQAKYDSIVKSKSPR